MKKLLAVLMSLVMVFGIAACGAKEKASEVPGNKEDSTEQSQNDGTKGKIGMLALSFSYDFQINMSKGIKKAADEFGYEYYEYDFQNDSEKEINGIETLLNSGVESFYGIFMSPDAAAAKIKEYGDVGVLSQGVMSAANAVVTTNYTEMAEFFCESLKKHIKENNLSEGDIACLWLPTCENKDSEFYQAMLDIQKVIHTEFDGTAYNYNDDYVVKDVEDVANGTVQIMNSNPKVRFFFTFNNNYATLCANEISAATSDCSDYFVFSTAEDQEVLKQISSGTSPLRACALGDVVTTGYEVGCQLIRYIESGEMENVAQKKVLVDSSNIKDYYTE